MHTGIDEDVTGQHCSALQHNCSLLDICHLIDNTLHSALQHSARSKAKSFSSTFQHPALLRPMPLSCKENNYAVFILRREVRRPCLQSKLEKGVIALPGEVVGAAKGGLHVGNASKRLYSAPIQLLISQQASQRGVKGPVARKTNLNCCE